MSDPNRIYVEGERVQIFPLSRRALGHLDYSRGTVVRAFEDGDGFWSYHVRLNSDGETIGLGAEAMEPLLEKEEDSPANAGVGAVPQEAE